MWAPKEWQWPGRLSWLRARQRDSGMACLGPKKLGRCLFSLCCPVLGPRAMSCRTDEATSADRPDDGPHTQFSFLARTALECRYARKRTVHGLGAGAPLKSCLETARPWIRALATVRKDSHYRFLVPVPRPTGHDSSRESPVRPRTVDQRTFPRPYGWPVTAPQCGSSHQP